MRFLSTDSDLSLSGLGSFKCKYISLNSYWNGKNEINAYEVGGNKLVANIRAKNESRKIMLPISIKNRGLERLSK